MKLRAYIAKIFGGIRNAINEYSQAAAVVRAVDERTGKRGAHGKNRLKNPFRGIACSNGSAYGAKYFRHVEGARDTRRARLHLFQHRIVRKFKPDVMPHPVSFSE